MDEARSLQDYLKILKRRKLSLLLPALACIAFTLVLGIALRATFESRATLMIMDRYVPQSYLRASIDSLAARRLQLIGNRVLSDENIAAIVDKFDLYSMERSDSRYSPVQLANRFRANTQTDLLGADVVDSGGGRPADLSIRFNLAFKNASAATAQGVTEELAALFFSEQRRERMQQSAEAARLVDAEVARLSKELLQVEQQVVDFKARNEGALPDLYAFNVAALERTRDDIAGLTQQLQASERRKRELAAELGRLGPIATEVSPSREDAASSDADRLKALQAEYRRRVATFSDDPRHQRELQDMQRAITGLQRSLAQAGSQPRTDNTASAADKRAYAQLRTQLNTIDSELRSLLARKRELAATAEQYETLLKRAPEVERDYRALLRDHDNVSDAYQDVTAKLREAEATMTLEQQDDRERTVVIEPATLPLQPVSPDRRAIGLFGLLVAAGAGIGFALLREVTDVAIHGARELGRVMGEPPLAAIPYMDNALDSRQRQRVFGLNLVAVLGAGLLLLFYLHYLFMPLGLISSFMGTGAGPG